MVTVTIGPTGSGKSTFIGRLLRYLYKYKMIIIIDDSDFYTRFLPNLKVVNLSPIDNQYNRIDLDKLIRACAMKEQDQPLLLISRDMDVKQMQEFLDKLGTLLLRQYKNTILVIDEAYRLFPRYKFSQSIGQLMRSGRKKGLSVYLVFQQFRDIDPAGVREATWGIGFKPQGPSEIENFQKTFDFYDQNRLGPHSCIIKNFRTGEWQISTLKFDNNKQ